MGKETILALANHNPARIYLAARNPSKGLAAAEDVKKIVPNAPISFVECDLSSLSSVRNAAEQVISQTQRLDILVCNAGIVAVPMGQSKDGYEIQFATNHLGHALLIQLFLPILKKTAEQYLDARIISLTSRGASFTVKEGIQFETLHTAQKLGMGGRAIRYGQSKLANILYIDELSRRYPQLVCLSIYPGMSKTELYTTKGWFFRALVHISTWLQGEWMVSRERGVYNQLWAATISKKNILQNGGFYHPVGQLAKPLKHSEDDELREKLWTWTEKQLDSYIL